MAFKNEAELAARVVEYLKKEDWEVYQEVEPRRFGSIADIVAVQGYVVWVIECKLSMSMDLLGQAMGWQGYAHRVSVAVPAPKRHRRDSNRNRFLWKACSTWGIGWLNVENTDWNDGVQEQIRPGFQRRLVDNRVRDSLTEKHKTYAKAGTNTSRRWTPFQNTCDQIYNLVRRHPGISLKEIIETVNHHYSSDSGARASVSHWVKKGVIKGVRAERKGRHLRFYADSIKDP